MLILTRRPGQTILIGDDIAVTINKVDGTKVQVGVEAPQNVRILRRELPLICDSDGDANSLHANP